MIAVHMHGGSFDKVKLEALITDVKVGKYKDNRNDFDEFSNHNTVTIYSNQNPVAQADCYANAGNGDIILASVPL